MSEPQQRTHAEIEAEIFDYIEAARRYAEDAKKARNSLAKAAQDQRQAIAAQNDSAKALAEARKNLRSDVQRAVASEAGNLRRSAVVADWAAIAFAFMVGIAIGGIGVYAWLMG